MEKEKVEAIRNRAGILCRVSTRGQKTRKLSLPDQERALIKAVEDDGCELLDVHKWIGQESGSTCNRPVMNEVMQAIKNAEIDILYVEDFSRLGRNKRELWEIVEIIYGYGVRIKSLYEGEIDLNNPDSELMFGIKSCIDDASRKKSIQKSGNRLQAKLEIEGHRNLGHLLYGLQWATDKKSAIHHPEEYSKVRVVIELRLSLKWSHIKTADFLNAKFNDNKGNAIARKHQVALPAFYKKENQLWDRYKVGYIFNNPKYYLGESSVEFRDKEYKYKFPPLMSKSEYNELKKVTPTYISTGPPQTYLLSNKLICGLCGGRLYHNIIANKYKGKKKQYNYYVCRNKLETAANGKRCKLPSVPQDWLEKEIWQELISFFRDNEKFEKAVLAANSKMVEGDMQSSKIADEIVASDKALEANQKSIMDIMDLIVDRQEGTYSKEIANQKLDALEKERTRLVEKQQELEIQESMLCRTCPNIQRLDRIRKRWLPYFFTLEPEQKRKVIDELVEEIIVWPFKQFFDDETAYENYIRKYNAPAILERPAYWDPEDCRTPAIVGVKIKGRIPITSDESFYRSGKNGICQAAALYCDCASTG